jgi:hypothetical protein
MEPLEAAVLKHIERAVLSEDIIVDAARRAIERYRETRTSASDRRERLERAHHEVGREIERYVHAIGQGVDVAEIHDALSKAKTRRDALTQELAALAAPQPTVSLDRSQITKHLRQWRGRLREAHRLPGSCSACSSPSRSSSSGCRPGSGSGEGSPSARSWSGSSLSLV